MKYNDNGLWKTLNVKVTDTLPVGTIIPYAGTTIPSNYMKCEGQELSRIEYDILFSAIGTTYGAGDGSTTFNLPNLKGRVITGIDSNDTDFDVLGETGGEKEHTLTVDEIPTMYAKAPTSTSGGNITYFKNDSIGGYNGNGAGTTIATIAGGDQPHNNLQPYIVLNYIIKVLDAPAIQAQVVNGYSTSSRDSYSCNYVNELIKSSQGYIELGDIQIIYGSLNMIFQPGENSQTIQFEKSFIDNNYVVTLTFQYQTSYYTQLGPVVYEKNTTNVKLGAYNSHTGNVPETLGYMIIGKKSTN